jgi:hypothetical protein
MESPSRDINLSEMSTCKYLLMRTVMLALPVVGTFRRRIELTERSSRSVENDWVKVEDEEDIAVEETIGRWPK